MQNDVATDPQRDTPLTRGRSLDVHGEWQPIETAPRDNSAVLLYVPMETIHFVATAFWDTVKQDWFVAWTGLDNPRAKVFNPTHWMPLPSPPVQS